MAKSRFLDGIAVAAILLALVLAALLLHGETFGLTAKAAELGYESRIFDTDRVHTVDICIDDWEAFLQTCQSEEYSLCDVVIDGELFSGVGIRGKGNTSLSTVASMDSDRYSFKLEFDQYDAGQTYHGLDKLSLNNLIQDNTMMKDYLVYRMMGEFGLAAPLCSYVYITVNGEDWGLYLAVEAVEDSFLRRNYGTDAGELYKPDSMELGGGRGNGRDFDPDAAMEQTESGTAPGNGRGGGMAAADVLLQYIDDNADSYASIFDNAKTNVTEADQQRLIDALQRLSSGEDVESAVNTEAVIRYFVVHNYVVNGDSYTGSMVHNYYLYEENGCLSMIPWDYNLAFGTFQGSSADAAVNDAIDAPLSVTGTGRPMIDWIFADEACTERYHAAFREFLDAVDPERILRETEAMITPYVERDPTKFCTTEEFSQGVEALSTFCRLRTESVKAQLAGETATVDASSLVLSDMGTMNRGGMMQPSMLQEETGEMPTVPEGMMPPTDGGVQMPAIPDGMTLPEQGELPVMPGDQAGMQPPTGMERPQGMEEFRMPGPFEAPQSQAESIREPEQSFDGAREMQESASDGKASGILLGVSLLVLAAALAAVFKFRR